MQLESMASQGGIRAKHESVEIEDLRQTKEMQGAVLKDFISRSVAHRPLIWS